MNQIIRIEILGNSFLISYQFKHHFRVDLPKQFLYRYMVPQLFKLVTDSFRFYEKYPYKLVPSGNHPSPR